MVPHSITLNVRRLIGSLSQTLILRILPTEFQASFGMDQNVLMQFFLMVAIQNALFLANFFSDVANSDRIKVLCKNCNPILFWNVSLHLSPIVFQFFRVNEEQSITFVKGQKCKEFGSILVSKVGNTVPEGDFRS